MTFRPIAASLLLVCLALMSCKTIESVNGSLKDWQESATPEPLQSLSPAREHRREKAAMVQWIEQHLKHEYRVVDQRFVLAPPGSTDFASIGSRANHYVTQTLSGTLKVDGWLDDDNYMMFLWEFGDSSPRYVAFAITNDFVSGTHERSLVGYFELVPSKKH